MKPKHLKKSTKNNTFTLAKTAKTAKTIITQNKYSTANTANAANNAITANTANIANEGETEKDTFLQNPIFLNRRWFKKK